MPYRWLTGFLAVLLCLTACTSLPHRDPNRWSGKVGESPVLAKVGEVTVAFPAGVAPAGTRATITLASDDAVAPSGLTPLSRTVDVALEGGAQPAQPVAITLPLTDDAAPEVLTESHLLLVEATSDDGTQTYSVGTVDATARTVTVSVDHFTRHRVLGLDLGAFMDEVRKAVMQGLGLEHPAPACVGTKAAVKGNTYEVRSSPATHLCLSEENGNLVVTAHPASAMPYVMTSSPKSRASTELTEASTTKFGMVRAAELLGFTSGGKAATFPGANARLVFTGAPTAASLTLEQHPALLLMSILATTVDTMGFISIEELDALQCLTDVADWVRPGDISGESVGAFTRAFFTCAATFGDLTPLGKVVLAALSAGPAFIATAVIGMINEIKGEATQRVDLAVTAPKPAPTLTLQPYLNARFGYSCLIPIDWRTQEADNSDGITAIRADRTAEVRCWGSHMSLTAAEYRQSFVRDGYTLTYEKVTPSVITLSGTKGSTIRFERYEFRDDIEIAMQWLYPIAEKEQFDAPVSRAAAALG